MCDDARMNTRTLFLAAALVAAVSLAPARADTPPDAERAAQALKDSPRHGEWVDIALPAAGGAAGAADAKPVTIKTWVVYPERKDKAPVVLVIHEIFGMTDWVRGVADVLAAEGFIAVAPDLLSGMGPDGGGTESLGDKAREEIRKLTPAESARRLDACRAWGLAQPAASQKTGSVGFCWGGSTSFSYATLQPALNGAVVYYGTAPTDAAALAKIACPVLGLYGGSDARVTSTVEATTKAMADAKKTYTPHTYEGAGHGFLRQQSGQEGANKKAADQAWTEMVEFFKKNLDSGAK